MGKVKDGGYESAMIQARAGTRPVRERKNSSFNIPIKRKKKDFFRTGKNGEFLYGYFCLSDSPPEAVGPRKFGPHRGQHY